VKHPRLMVRLRGEPTDVYVRNGRVRLSADSRDVTDVLTPEELNRCFGAHKRAVKRQHRLGG
jgi:hypothetical protein